MTRKITTYCLALLFLMACLNASLLAQPNVVYINVDDLGYKDLGFTGSSFYETPNIDRLAKEGMIFTQAYAAAANCAPSRACLLTGLNTPRHGIYTVANSDRGDTRLRKIIPTPNQTVLADSFYTIAELFQDAGYVTASIGKWHIGEDPTTQGFQINVAGSHRGHPNKNGYFSPYGIQNLEDGPKGEYLTDRLTSEAISFLNTHQKDRFFLYLPFYTVHTPLGGKSDLVEKFSKKSSQPGQQNAEYAAMVASMDENVGRLLANLKELGLDQNTLVVFTSDNGGIRTISHQDPLRAGKGSYYEGGIRVPLIMRWPGQIKPGTYTDSPVTSMDFFPTFKALINNKKTMNLDGNDLSGIFKGKNMGERNLIWHFPIYLGAYAPAEDNGRDPLFRTRPGTVIRQGDWKLFWYFEDNAIELYNLKEDVGEQHNLATENTKKVETLLWELKSWISVTNAPVPTTPNPEYDPGFEKEKIANSGK